MPSGSFTITSSTGSAPVLRIGTRYLVRPAKTFPEQHRQRAGAEDRNQNERPAGLLATAVVLTPWENIPMLIRASLAVDEVALREFCRRNGIRSLALFGSVLRNDFGPESDVDVLVEFEDDSLPGLIGLARMELELEALFGGRSVDLRTYGSLSRYFRDEVRATAELVYDAAA